jgi:hypothetical protein
MDLETMTREDLIQEVKNMQKFMDNVVVFWGGKKEYRETFEEVAKNEADEYTAEEAKNAKVILEKEGAFDAFIEIVRDSFERGGINYMLSEKVSELLEEVGNRYA